MKKYIALLRGINVGGHKKFPKADQLEMLSELGVSSPQVYLHTGNWIFQSSKNKEILQSELLKAIRDKQGWEVPILIKTASEIITILKNCPFPEEKKGKSYFVLPFQQPPSDKVEQLNTIPLSNEEFVITSHCIYLYSSLNHSDSKLSNNFFEKKLKITATARNYNTMMAILDMSQ